MDSSLDEGAQPLSDHPLHPGNEDHHPLHPVPVTTSEVGAPPAQAVQVYQPSAAPVRRPGQSIADVIDAEWTPEDREVIRATVAKHSTDAEMRVFLWLCMRYGMDPFLGEMWCYKRLKANDNPEDVPAIISVSVDGYLRHAATQPGYLGPPSFGVVREDDHYKMDWVNGVIEHVAEKPTGAIVGAWARMEREGVEKPAVMFIPFHEASPNYPFQNQQNNPWNTQPSMMVVKTPLGYVTRRLFPMGGLPTREELESGQMQEALEYTGAHEAKVQQPRSVDDQLLGAAMEDAAKALLAYRGYNQGAINRKGAEHFQAEQAFLESALRAPFKRERWEALQEMEDSRTDAEIIQADFGLAPDGDGGWVVAEVSEQEVTGRLNQRDLYPAPLDG